MIISKLKMDRMELFKDLGENESSQASVCQSSSLASTIKIDDNKDAG